MKEGIHPKYEQTTIRCACGAVIETGSTKKDITVEICSKCHPFYTGKQKLVDTSGRVDKFNKKYGIKPRTGGARPPFLSDATEPSLFLYCFPVCRDARPGARRKDSPRQRARLHKRRLCFLRPRRRKAAVPLGRDRGLFFFYNVFRFAARRLRRTLQITKSIGRLYKDLTSVLSIATKTHAEGAARFDIYATKK